MIARFTPGAPGVYELPPEPLRALTGERLDVCAFVGVAPRGPCHLPALAAAWAPQPPRGGPTRRSLAVAVESWTEYRALFGGFEGPGLLPYAVAAFFENGGRRAWIVRVAPGAIPPDDAVARGAVGGLSRLGSPDPVVLRARSEGRWGRALSATVRFSRAPLEFDPAASSLAELEVGRGAPVAAGSTVRLRCTGGEVVLRIVSALREQWRPEDGAVQRFALLDRPLPSAPIRAERVDAELTVKEEGARSRGELHGGLSLGAAHPRFIGRVIVEASRLLYVDERAGFDWSASDLDVDPSLPTLQTGAFGGGADRFGELVPQDFFSGWVPGDEEPGDGVHALVEVPDAALLCAPDLYAPFPIERAEAAMLPGTFAGPDFAECLTAEPLPPPPAIHDELLGLRLDPNLDFDDVVALQQQVVTFAEQVEQFVALLDVPPGLLGRRVDRWRAQFGSAWAAAYHPWLHVSRADDARGRLLPIPPSAFAAGIIAAREWSDGIPHGPANSLARGAVSLFEPISPARHAALHQQHLNVYVRERDGVRLSAARTLSRDPQWRQLSVRRLVTLLRRVLARQMQWMVFEPNGRALRKDTVDVLVAYLRQLHRANAFAGRTEREAFFVRCDDALNPPYSVDAGRLVIEVGVAPAEPLEFIVLRISRDGDGTLRVEDGRG